MEADLSSRKRDRSISPPTLQNSRKEPKLDESTSALSSGARLTTTSSILDQDQSIGSPPNALAATMNNRSQTKATFLTIPRELRDRIYDLVLTDQMNTALSSDSITVLVHAAPKQNVQLVSRQIRTEYISRFLALGSMEIFNSIMTHGSVPDLPHLLTGLRELKVHLLLHCHSTRWGAPRSHECTMVESMFDQRLWLNDIINRLPLLERLDVEIRIDDIPAVGICLDKAKTFEMILCGTPKLTTLTIDVGDLDPLEERGHTGTWMQPDGMSVKRIYVMGEDRRLERMAQVPKFPHETGQAVGGLDTNPWMLHDRRHYRLMRLGSLTG